MPGMTRTGVPPPRSTSLITLITQRLARFQRVLDALLCLPLAEETQECLALEIQQLLLGDDRRMRQRASSHDGGQLPADQRVVIADAPGAPRQVNAKFQR